MKKYFLLVVSAVALAFTSCSNSEEIEIKYQANITVAVDKLMEPFQERKAGDFDIKEDMSIRIQSYVYDANGILVQSCISSVNDYSKTVAYSAVLENVIYKVVSIADFITGKTNNPTNSWWNVTGENNIITYQFTLLSGSDYINIAPISFMKKKAFNNFTQIKHLPVCIVQFYLIYIFDPQLKIALI